MKKLLFLFWLAPTLLFGIDDPSLSKLKVLKHTSWYEDQVVFWKRKIDKDPQASNYWHNYYFNLSNANAPADVKNKVAEEILKKWPEDFNSKLIAIKNYGFNQTGLAYYKDLLQEDPLHPEVLSLGVLLAEINQNKEERTTNSKVIYESQLISSSLYNYAYNLLMSVGQDGVLFTEGDNTSIPIFVLQDVLKIRTDVNVISLSLLQEPTYQKQIIAKWPIISDQKDIKSLLKNIPINNSKRQFYYSLTINRDLLGEFGDQLYLTGLALKYNSKPQSNSIELEENVSRFLVDYLITRFNFEGNSATGRVLEPNYLLSFIILKQLYKKTNRIDDLQKMDQLICSVSDHAGLTEKIQNILDPKEKVITIFKKDKIAVKKLEKRMKPVTEKLYASETEVTNDEYQRFLIYLEDFQYPYQLNISKVDLSNSNPLSTTATYFNPILTDQQRKKTTPKHAVTNISHIAAQSYCDWLSQQYNLQRNRKFKKVKFRLPTKQEWQIAALGYKNFQSWELDQNEVKAYVFDQDKFITQTYKTSKYKISYPWYGVDFDRKDLIKNQFDCYLANVLDSKCDCPSQKDGDGYPLVAPVGSYYANGMGLFDVVGNVAEMLQEPGKAAGGSWAHPPESSTISSISSYKGPDAKVGFRVFMEIIEQ